MPAAPKAAPMADQTLSFISDAELDALKTKHKNLWHVEIEETQHNFLLRKPTTAEYDRAFAGLADDDKRASALRTLVVVCVVYPERSEVNAILAEYPGYAIKLGNEAMKFAGTSAVATSKKL